MTYILRQVTATLFAASLIGGMATSCIKDEPLNAECDIERVVLCADNLETILFQMSDTARTVLSADSTVTYRVRSTADLSAIALNLQLTPGATVTPANGSVQDFSNGPVFYTVTSEDGQWHRHYRIEFERTVVAVSDTIFIDFEDYELEPVNQSYYIWLQDMGDGVKRPYWASGNSGFKLSKRTALPNEYPTMPEVDGYDGACLHLYTRDTGAFGQAVKKPIAAGNFFLGEFDVNVAVKKPMQSTHFGRPFDRKPLRFSGYYKYKAGDTFKDRNGKVVDRLDNGSIYAVFYLNHDEDGQPVMLYGDDVQTNSHIVAMAKVPDVHQTDEWTYFETDFVYSKDIDMALLADYGYNLTIVFSSSVDGDLFEGAIGSEMYVDKVRLISTHNE